MPHFKKKTLILTILIWGTLLLPQMPTDILTSIILQNSSLKNGMLQWLRWKHARVTNQETDNSQRHNSSQSY